ncbi:TRAP transporter large permease [Neorhizobium galegae]|jgi:TRAP-type transport system large permease protein|uniref:TRAP transporter large permease protein n=1 Tax=Neorhizobium galegae bv. officinalis TaxID=323656 RepID=A0A0T7GQZ6_NEOGA|nr:TRAP transporter large permease [Neorhizobium galegae]CDZ49703.1 TRAP transporter, DctM subunit [Neorhizobium galegae bv. officinalis]
MLLVATVFTVLLVIGMPIAFAVGISGVVFFLQNPDLPRTMTVQLTVTETQNFALLAVPLFILAGNFLNSSGIAHNLLKLASVLTGRLQGGLAQVSIALSTLMSGVTGSSIADAAMNTRLLGFEMLKRGFSKGYAAGVLSYGSLMAPIIPPGIGFILYGTVGQVSIGRLFAAGIIPGFMLWAALAVTISITARKHGYKPELDRAPTPSEVFKASIAGSWAILFPIILIFGLRFGVFTPSEIGAFAVVYAFLVGVFAYRMLTWTSFKQAVEASLIDVGAVMFLLALSAVFGYGIIFERIPEVISTWMLGITDDPTIVMVIIVLFILVAGTFMEGSVLIVMLTPIFMPLIQQYGIDPVHFGLVFIIAATIGNYTPPVGGAMFVVCQILRCPIEDYARESMPFLIAVSLVTLLLIFMPGIVLYMPNLLFNP